MGVAGVQDPQRREFLRQLRVSKRRPAAVNEAWRSRWTLWCSVSGGERWIRCISIQLDSNILPDFLAQNFQVDFLTWKIMWYTELEPWPGICGEALCWFGGVQHKGLARQVTCQTCGVSEFWGAVASVSFVASFYQQHLPRSLLHDQEHAHRTSNIRRQHGPPSMLWDIDGRGTTIGCCQTARNWLASWWKLGESYIVALHTFSSQSTTSHTQY